MTHHLPIYWKLSETALAEGEVLALRDVRLRRGARTILEGLTFSVRGGEMLGILGPNGAGKTTLLETITAEVPYEGSLKVWGNEVASLPRKERSYYRTCIGLVPQLSDQPPPVPLTVEEVVAIGRTARRGLFRRLDRGDREAVAYWLHRFDLTDLARRPFPRLSGGERRKVHLARALAQEPDVLLLDEPAGHLDLRWQEEMTTLVAQLRQEIRLTVVMVTHEARHLPVGCDRLLLLGRGRMLGFGPPAEVLRPEALSRAFGVDLEVVRREGRYHVLPLEKGTEAP